MNSGGVAIGSYFLILRILCMNEADAEISHDRRALCTSLLSMVDFS